MFLLNRLRLARFKDADMGISEAEMLQLESLVGLFVEKKPAPRNSTARRSRNTASFAQLLVSASTVLRRQMDKSALKFKASKPAFYQEYVENRKVMDVGVRSGTKKE